MSKDEVKKALPEMVLFAKTEEERNHFKKLQTMETLEEMDEETRVYVSQNPDKVLIKNDYKSAYKTKNKTRTP